MVLSKVLECPGVFLETEGGCVEKDSVCVCLSLEAFFSCIALWIYSLWPLIATFRETIRASFRNQFGLRYGVTSRVSHGCTFSTTAWVSVSGIRASEVFHLCGFHGFTRCVRARTLRSIINQQPRLACKIVVYCCVVLR